MVEKFQTRFLSRSGSARRMPGVFRARLCRLSGNAPFEACRSPRLRERYAMKTHL